MGTAGRRGVRPGFDCSRRVCGPVSHKADTLDRVNTTPNFPLNPDDLAKTQAALEELRAEAEERHNQMFALGYTMAAGIGSQIAT
jgi:hypothetical protein